MRPQEVERTMCCVSDDAYGPRREPSSTSAFGSQPPFCGVEHASEPPLVMGSADGDRIEVSCEALDEFATGPPLRWLLLIMLPPSAYSLI